MNWYKFKNIIENGGVVFIILGLLITTAAIYLGVFYFLIGFVKMAWNAW